MESRFQKFHVRAVFVVTCGCSACYSNIIIFGVIVFFFGTVTALSVEAGRISDVQCQEEACHLHWERLLHLDRKHFR